MFYCTFTKCFVVFLFKLPLHRGLDIYWFSWIVWFSLHRIVYSTLLSCKFWSHYTHGRGLACHDCSPVALRVKWVFVAGTYSYICWSLLCQSLTLEANIIQQSFLIFYLRGCVYAFFQSVLREVQKLINA